MHVTKRKGAVRAAARFMREIVNVNWLREGVICGENCCRLFLCWPSSELRWYYRFQDRGSEICLPVGQILPSQLVEISYESRPHIYRLCHSKLIPKIIPVGFLAIIAYSCLGWPSLQMVPYHSTPPSLILSETTAVIYWLSFFPWWYDPPVVHSSLGLPRVAA